jgi:hypothetical protein
MLPYDPRVNYFGAENTKLADILGEILKLMPALRDGWNYAAYNHDKAYSGKKKTGFFARIINFYKRKAADRNFRAALEEAVTIAEVERKISYHRADRAMTLAKYSYKAVRALGWKFYRTA